MTVYREPVMVSFYMWLNKLAEINLCTQLLKGRTGMVHFAPQTHSSLVSWGPTGSAGTQAPLTCWEEMSRSSGDKFVLHVYFMLTLMCDSCALFHWAMPLTTGVNRTFHCLGIRFNYPPLAEKFLTDKFGILHLKPCF